MCDPGEGPDPQHARRQLEPPFEHAGLLGVPLRGGPVVNTVNLFFLRISTARSRPEAARSTPKLGTRVKCAHIGRTHASSSSAAHRELRVLRRLSAVVGVAFDGETQRRVVAQEHGDVGEQLGGALADLGGEAARPARQPSKCRALPCAISWAPHLCPTPPPAGPPRNIDD